MNITAAMVKELREISMEFNARYISGEEAPTVRSSCPMR